MPQSSLLFSDESKAIVLPVAGPNSSVIKIPPALFCTSECSTVEFVTDTRWIPSPQSPGANGVVKHSPAPEPTSPENPVSLFSTTTWSTVTLLIGEPLVSGVPAEPTPGLPTRMPANRAFITVQPSITDPEPPGPETSIPYPS